MERSQVAVFSCLAFCRDSRLRDASKKLVVLVAASSTNSFAHDTPQHSAHTVNTQICMMTLGACTRLTELLDAKTYSYPQLPLCVYS